MDQFNNAHQSFEHSRPILEMIERYDDFMDSVTSVADMGCGSGMDINWWARNEYIEVTEDEQGNIYETIRPRNYRCYAIDRDVKQIQPELLPDNVHIIEGNFERKVLSRPVDLMWSHNSFQYATNPIGTLKLWNEQLVENGMLCMCFPVQTDIINNHLVSRGQNLVYFNHNFLSMIYMLAVNGFDCRDAYFLKRDNDPWLHLAVYKSEYEPMDPSATTWYDLAEKNLLNDSMKNSLNTYGYVRQEDLLYIWLDKNFYRVNG